ncbi:MAG: cation:proton antiporter, partial [Acidimicrobiia bacterium]|nr:cation:proton antiporter [Acidimicrobiia bacterium]
MNLVAPGEHQLLVFWTQLLVLLVVARLLGQAMRRIGQPAVVGQLGAGLLLGPSLLGRVAPGVLDWLVPADPLQSGMLFAVSWIGILLLLIETGFETDLALIRRLGKATALVSAGSIVLPLIAGLFVGTALPDVFRGELDDPTVFALFVGAALSISSLAVAGKVLSDLGLMRRNFGQVTLAAGMANDVVGWIMLGIVAALASAGEIAVGPLLVTVVGIAVLYGGGLTVGQRVVDYVLREVRRRDVTPTGYITVVLVIALVFGVATQLIGAEA